MNPAWPREMLTTVSFRDLGGKTEVTIEWIPVDGSTELELGTFDKRQAELMRDEIGK